MRRAIAGLSVRHMVTVPNGDIWIACSGVDKIGRVRVKKD